jgi:hypothetical protein
VGSSLRILPVIRSGEFFIEMVDDSLDIGIGKTGDRRCVTGYRLRLSDGSQYPSPNQQWSAVYFFWMMIEVNRDVFIWIAFYSSLSNMDMHFRLSVSFI